MKSYDVIIVGAGNAGLMTAHRLFGSGLKTLLLDSSQNPLVPTNHIYGTFDEIIQKYDLNRYVINSYDTFVFQCPGTVVKFDWSKTPYRCLDTHPWVKDLTFDCETIGSTLIAKARREDGRIILTTEKGEEISGKMVVDCSGDKKIVSHALGIKTYIEGYVDLTYIYSNCEVKNTNEVIFMSDLRYFNITGWWYPYNNREGFFGLANLNDLRDYTREEMEINKDLFIKENEPFTSYLKNATSKFELFKVGPPTKLNERIIDDNFIAVGDAAGAGTTFCGEGFRIALEMGNKAAEVVKQAFGRNDFSKKSLKDYESFYWDEFGRFARVGRIFTYIFVRTGTNKLTGLLFKSGKDNWTQKEFYAFAKNEITLNMLRKLITSEIGWIMLKNLTLFYLHVPFSKE